MPHQPSRAPKRQIAKTARRADRAAWDQGAHAIVHDVARTMGHQSAPYVYAELCLRLRGAGITPRPDTTAIAEEISAGTLPAAD
jgi:hypothetical protein